MLATLAMLALAPMAQSNSGYVADPLPLGAVKLTDTFWKPRLDSLYEVTADHEINECHTTGRIDNFYAALGEDGKKHEGYVFNDSDVYKVIEGIANLLILKPDAELKAKADKWVQMIAKAQEPDGYLDTAKQVYEFGLKSSANPNKWSNIRDEHELYCAGHLYEAAVAWKHATGDDTLLKVAVKNANLVCSVFNDKGNRNPPGHEEIEIGLFKLADETGNDKYRQQAVWFLNQRGHRDGRTQPDYGPYAQDQAPIVDQDEAVGHAVRAGYLYNAMAMADAWKSQPGYATALDKIWHSVADTKLYLTGGIGSTGSGEAFGAPYDLPNMSAYQETCATIANAMWNQRMFQSDPDAKYVDIVERAVYNSLLSGIGLDGKTFFYTNPLQSLGAQRPAWYACSCCPPNVLRTIPNLTTWMYCLSDPSTTATSPTVYVNLYAANEADMSLPAPGNKDVAVHFSQKTEYPWNGDIKLAVDPATPAEFTLSLRIPGWARNEPYPSPLYRFVNPSTKQATLSVNGQDVPVTLDKGYVHLRRTWKKGDSVRLVLPFEPRFVKANPAVEADQGRVAVSLGPLVYCAEFADQADGHVFQHVVNPSSTLQTTHLPDFLGGVTVVDVASQEAKRGTDGQITASGKSKLRLIPYYAWANRGTGQMAVWLPTQADKAWPVPAPTLASTSKVTNSANRSSAPLIDQLLPANSGDESVPFYHWWPSKGKLEWIELDLAKPAKVSKVGVYWFDDTGRGECRVPASWKVKVKKGDEWVDVQGASAYPVYKDKMCEVTFTPVQTTAVRLEIQSQKDWAGGAFEVEVK